MKTLIASVLALASLNTFAASIPLHEEVESSVYRVNGTYGINEEMGRAWVELTIDTSSDVDSTPDYVKVKVPGMSIVGGSVVVNVEGQQVECAKIRPVGIFRYRTARPTGNCQFKTKVEKRQVDDGFYVRTVKYVVISLETK